MSAYIVDRETIIYLVSAATSRQLLGHHGHAHRWYHAGEHHELACGDHARAVEVGQMLWDACIESVSARYPNDTKESLPGPIGETYVYDKHKPLIFHGFDPVQVLKTCHCWQYQSCEVEGWQESEANTFIEALISYACRALPGYEEAEWGAPQC